MKLEFKLNQKPETKRYKKESRGPVAKEVGMGNPAEKTTRHPTERMITEGGWVLARDFFENFLLPLLPLRYILAHGQPLNLFCRLLSNDQPIWKPALVHIRATTSWHQRRSSLRADSFHPSESGHI